VKEWVGVRPFARLIRPPHHAAAGLLLWARRAGDIDRLLHGRRSAAAAPQQMRAVLPVPACYNLTMFRCPSILNNVANYEQNTVIMLFRVRFVRTFL